VVRGGHEDGIRVLVDPLTDIGQDLVVHEGVNGVSGGVIGVASVLFKVSFKLRGLIS
jgi:hypothetical protein